MPVKSDLFFRGIRGFGRRFSGFSPVCTKLPRGVAGRLFPSFPAGRGGWIGRYVLALFVPPRRSPETGRMAVRPVSGWCPPRRGTLSVSADLRSPTELGIGLDPQFGRIQPGHLGFVVDPDEPPEGMHHSTQILLDEPVVQYLSSSDCLEVLDTDISWQKLGSGAHPHTAPHSTNCYHTPKARSSL